MIEELSLVHILRPGRLPYCDNNCLRPECLDAIYKGTPLLCEAYSQEDVERVKNQWGIDELEKTFLASEIYRTGLAFLVVMAEYENRKKYKGQELGEAIFAFLRAARYDPDYLKRIVVLLAPVAITQEHFSLSDLEAMFGEDVAMLVSQFTPLPDESIHHKPYLVRLKSDPLVKEIALYHYRAKLDFLKITSPNPSQKRRWNRCLKILLE